MRCTMLYPVTSASGVSLQFSLYPSVGRLNTIFSAKKVISSACVNTSGSEARCEIGFTSFIVGPSGGPGQFTESRFVV